ncbi:DUF2264 domain-containing protein [Streptomyces sp. RS10V-4]|uniref:DUF2264 domain-containing protein n=1 Tax=Streptomyces rhizoryzae TaxID=2932493 RepID=UPI0020034427|nr:DUF2264 domain-containing protein [Streptomyces rhizoryzae]MCK7622290.1 DUF2264 domain-containing protein [Streptomyces rhizoryzae]
MATAQGGGAPLPPEDRALSPFTGYGRAHWVALADHLLADARRFASPAGARIVLPGRPSSSGPDSDQLEGFARTFLLLAFRTAGCGGEAPAGLVEAYAAGLRAGTDPRHPEAWPALGQDCPQTLVEACSLALGLHLTRPWLWDHLPSVVREQLTDWLQGAFGLRIPDNNWHLFRVIVGEFLAGVGAAHDRAEMAADLARTEEFYAGDGWYRDGGDPRTSDHFDHYNGWALHLYPLLWARMAGARAADRLPEYTARLRRFLADFALFFGADGAPMHQGRSLIYRFAAVAAPWMGALADATPLSPGQTRRLASGALRHFTDRGFRDRHGIATLGWYRPYPPMVQGYSGPGSPYWLAKAFLGLLLPATHPCWTEREEPLPVERGDRVLALPVPGLLLSATRADGIVRLLNHGSDNHEGDTRGSGRAQDGTPGARPPERVPGDPHYARLAYSTATGPYHDTGAWTPRWPFPTPDNHIGLRHPRFGLSGRTRIHRLRLLDRYAASWHRPVWRGRAHPEARIETAAVFWGAFELRAHLVEAPAGLDAYDSGWQVAGERPPRARTGDRWAQAVTGADLTSTFVSLAGHSAVAVAAVADGSAFGRHSAVPYATARRTTARSVHVALIALTGPGADPTPPDVHCTIEGTTVTAAFPDGTWILVALGARPPRTPAHLGGTPLPDLVRYARVTPGEAPVIH